MLCPFIPHDHGPLPADCIVIYLVQVYTYLPCPHSAESMQLHASNWQMDNSVLSADDYMLINNYVQLAVVLTESEGHVICKHDHCCTCCQLYL